MVLIAKVGSGRILILITRQNLCATPMKTGIFVSSLVGEQKRKYFSYSIRQSRVIRYKNAYAICKGGSWKGVRLAQIPSANKVKLRFFLEPTQARAERIKFYTPCK